MKLAARPMLPISVDVLVEFKESPFDLKTNKPVLSCQVVLEADSVDRPLGITKAEANPRTTDPAAIASDSGSPGFAVISNTIPRNTAILMVSEILRKGCRSRSRISD
jgi:hypothetical protein